MVKREREEGGGRGQCTGLLPGRDDVVGVSYLLYTTCMLFRINCIYSMYVMFMLSTLRKMV
jgi:hypothetical protein